MPEFNPLKYPIILSQPLRAAQSAWTTHDPFAMFIIDLLRPSIFVELGTDYGVSYCAFCQAVKALDLDARCYAIDTWQGDPHARYYGDEVLADLRKHHDPLYGMFSRLIQSTFDEALGHFSEGVIDLLHIDGYHTYEAVKHDFENWLPKMSRRGVVLFHDINVREKDFGVWKFWDELKSKYPSFELIHGYGLGLLAVGVEYPSSLNILLKMQADELPKVRDFFFQLGNRIETEQLVQIQNSQLHEKDQALHSYFAEKDAQIAGLNAQIAEINRSKAWRLALLLRKIRVALFPPRSFFFEDLIQIAYRALSIWRHEGFLPLMRKAKNRISRPSDVSRFSILDYQNWIRENEPGEKQLAEQKKASKLFSYRPLINILTPVYNTPAHILRATIQSIIDQTYDNWELCLVDGNSNANTKAVLEHFQKLDSRIKCEFLTENLGISGNTNVALKLAAGDYINLLDHDDVLPPYALFEIVSHINQNPEVEIIYGDEDRIDMSGHRHTPFFKPDWSPDLLLAFMYIGHSTYKTELVLSLGGFRSKYDFSQDYDLALRATDVPRKVGHISKVLYHWRELPGSAAVGDKDYARISNIAALADALKRRGYEADAIALPTHNQVAYHLSEKPLVSIIIPSDNLNNIRKSIESITKKTAYPNYEILVVTNSKLIPKIWSDYLEKPVRCIAFDQEYNFSAKCNRGVSQANGEYVLFLNDDVYPVTLDWIEKMLGPFHDKEVGAVSPKLVYTNGTIQHAGLVTGVRNLVGTAFHTSQKDTTQYFNMAQCPRPVSALSAACLLMRRNVFAEIGGYDEINTPIMHSDLDLCFKIREQGLRLVYMSEAELTHVGHLSIKDIEAKNIKHSFKADIYLLKKWGRYVSYDPYYPQNMRDLLYIDSPTPYRMFASNQLNPNHAKGDILFITHDLSLSGAPMVLNTLVSAAAVNGFYPVVISPEDGKLRDYYHRQNISLLIDPLIQQYPEAIKKLLNDFDLIVTSTILSWPAVIAAKEMDKSVIWFIYESSFGEDLARNIPAVSTALSVADTVIFPSEEIAKLYRKFTKGENFRVLLFNANVLDGIGQSGAEHYIATSSVRNLQVVHIGSVEFRKGQDVLIRSILEELSDVKNSFDFHFIGRVLAKDYYTELINLTSDLRNIHWVGELLPDEVMRYIRGADIFVCSSRDEAIPIVLLWAMSQGKPVLSTNVGGIPNIISNDINGILVPNEDYKALAIALRRLSKDANLREQLGLQAKKDYEEKFSNEKSINTFLELVNQEIKGHEHL